MSYTEKREMLYEGKAKKIFATSNPHVVIVHYKDDATANNAVKKGTVRNKGIINNNITTLLFQYLTNQGVENHFIEKMNDREQLCKKVKIIPIEFIIRNYIAGSMAKRLGLEEGIKPSNTIIDICYKDDKLGDPLINDHHAVAMNISTYEELQTIYKILLRINTLLQKVFLEHDILLIDFKVEFGKDEKSNILLADEITPDTCRLWDKTTMKKLDKDRFRRDLGGVEEAYIEILERLSNKS